MFHVSASSFCCFRRQDLWGNICPRPCLASPTVWPTGVDSQLGVVAFVWNCYILGYIWQVFWSHEWFRPYIKYCWCNLKGHKKTQIDGFPECRSFLGTMPRPPIQSHFLTVIVWTPPSRHFSEGSICVRVTAVGPSPKPTCHPFSLQRLCLPR